MAGRCFHKPSVTYTEAFYDAISTWEQNGIALLSFAGQLIYWSVSYDKELMFDSLERKVNPVLKHVMVKR